MPEDTGDLPLSGYRILRGDAGLDLSPIAELGPLVDQYRDEGLVNGRTYFYSVVGFNARGDGVPSTIVSVMPIGPPEQVMGFDGMAGDGTATLQWQAPSSDGGRPIIGYVLYRGSSNDDLAPLVVLGISFSYTDMELVNNQTVYYSITAYNELGNGSRVPPLPVHPVGPPTVPTLFAATPDDRRVTLIWDRPINDGGYPVTGYRIYRGPYVGALSNLATTGPVHSYTDTNVMNGETYLYQVRAVNVLGEGPPTSVLTSMPMGPPGAPVDLTMQALDRAFFLRWSAPLDWGGSQSLSYRVFRGDSIDTAQPLVELTGVQEYIDDDIIPGGMYVYLVRAVSVAGMGPRSNGVQAIAGTLPGEPRNITADAQNGYIALHWGPPDVGIWYPITQYVVFRGLFTSGLAEIARLTNTQSFNDTSVITGQTYHYAVAASNLIGTGPLSVIVSVKAGRSPFPPTGLELSVEDGRVMLKWYPPTMEMPGVDSYVVLRGEQRDLLVEIAIVTGQTSFTDDTTVRGKRYFYSIMARNEYGQSDNSTVESVEVPEIENKLLLTSMIIIGAAGVVMILMLGRLRTRLRRSVDRAQPEARRPGPER